MEITRINTYDDCRFSQNVLYQHGAYIIADETYEVEIVSKNSAIVRGKDCSAFGELIEEFRYHAPHINIFLNEAGTVIKKYPADEEIWVNLPDIQPSQFYIDQDKLDAVRRFVHSAEDIVVQVISWNNRYISLDGHTRLYLAHTLGFKQVKAVLVDPEEWVWQFVNEAQKRGIVTAGDMQLLPHDDYEVKWNQFCDSLFAENQ